MDLRKAALAFSLGGTLFAFARAPCAAGEPLAHFDTEQQELKDAQKQLRVLEKKIRSGGVPPVQFDFDKSVLRPESKEALQLMADILLTHPRLKLMVFGHTCDIGSAEYNLGLSRRRAEAVKSYLIQLGVMGESIRAKGFGLSKPAVPNDSEANRSLNRRVEFILTTRWWESVY